MEVEPDCAGGLCQQSKIPLVKANGRGVPYERNAAALCRTGFQALQLPLTGLPANRSASQFCTSPIPVAITNACSPR